jgi:hypothetical protein
VASWDELRAAAEYSWGSGGVQPLILILRAEAACHRQGWEMSKTTYWPSVSKWSCALAAAMSTVILVNHTASATTVLISRMGDGVVCNGWAVTPNIVATAAHCVLTPGHYSVSTVEKKYEVFRIWIHPEFSPEFLYNLVWKEELELDVAILQVIQRDLSIEAHDHLKSKDALQGAELFAVRAKRPERPDEIEELPYTKLELKKNGVAISNGDKVYGVCAGDAGMPLFARIGDAQVIVGVVVGTSPYGKLGLARSCEKEIHVIDASVILRFLESIEHFKR